MSGHDQGDPVDGPGRLGPARRDSGTGRTDRRGDRDRQQRGKDIVSTTESYVETFYPLWFTHFQFQVAPHNKLIGPKTISPLYQGVVAINDDTLYASSPIDVSGGRGESDGAGDAGGRLLGAPARSVRQHLPVAHPVPAGRRHDADHGLPPGRSRRHGW